MRKKILACCILALMLAISCDFKETLVTNTVHEDGSVTRKVSVRTSSKNNLDPDRLDVPVDSTWQIEVTWKMERKDDDTTKQDTVWYLTAEKHFESVEEINQAYQNDQGPNRELERNADFSKSFRWFSTVFRYSETVDKRLDFDCPLSDFLSEDEMEFAYWPGKVQKSLMSGPDSLKYKALSDSIETRTEDWFITCLVRHWIYAFYDLAGDRPDLKLSMESLLAKEPQMVKYLTSNDPDIDEDSVFAHVLGEAFYTSFRTEIDSAVALMEEKAEVFWDNSTYNMEIRMPGKIIDTNGYMAKDSANHDQAGVLWTVEPSCYFAQDYEMWVESRVNHYPLWVVTVAFLVFVIAGFIRFYKRSKTQK